MIQRVFLLVIIVIAVFLRFYQLSSIPPGLYVDEASIGYNAYSVLTNGTDEHGQAYPLWFKAFGEYKLPVYIYTTVISIAMFGKNEFAIRFPSAFFGSLTILIVYFFIKELLVYSADKIKIQFKYLPTMAAGILAVNPWHLQFSRVSYEATIALFLVLMGSWLLLLFYNTKKRIIFSSVCYFS